MAKLSDQLKYFVNKKVTEDANWRDIQVVLSGHEVPGEGEHKIMEYIRLSRVQPDYNPNVRHCLYGLDADLVMLGLLSHDPHFCLLREEVDLDRLRRKMGVEGALCIGLGVFFIHHICSLGSQTFYLLHLSLMREYLNLEFRETEPVLPFHYSLERVIDDFVLLAVFVGNDFLPNLPDLHIHENGLERLFDVYKKVLPSLGGCLYATYHRSNWLMVSSPDGYMHESGTINMKRLQVARVSWGLSIFPPWMAST
jgi:5'-3' exoribonuclease 1